MVRSSPKNENSTDRQPQVCYLHPTHPLKLKTHFNYNFILNCTYTKPNSTPEDWSDFDSNLETKSFNESFGLNDIISYISEILWHLHVGLKLPASVK